MRKLVYTLAACSVLMTAGALAQQQSYQHFKPKPSENLAQALANIDEYNAKLKSLTEGEMTAQDLAKVHEITYTLEVALARPSKELDVAANSLEQVHLGSEAMNQARVKGFAKDYLRTLDTITSAKKN
ncbi:MAG: hypothetical protein CMF13_03630 [Idiomarina sp.]|nr:hypothetical protein [Idiomarina sp.]